MLLSLLYSSALYFDSVFVCFTVCTYPKQRKDSWSEEEVTQVDDNLLCSCKMDKSFSASVHKVLARWVCRSSTWRCNQSNLETRWTDWPTDQHMVDIWYWIRVFIKCISYIFSLKILNFTFSASCNSKLSRRLPIFTCVLEYFIIILVMQYFNYIFSFPKNLSFCTLLSFFGCQGSNGCISSAQSSTSFHRGLSRWIMRTRKQTSKQTSLSQSSHTLFPPAAPPVV